MLNMKKVITIVSGLAMAMSLTSTTAVQAASFQAPKLGVAETTPTNPAIKKGEKIFVVVQDTKKQTVNVYTKDAKKTSQTVKMGTTWTVKATKKVDGKKIVRINKSQWLNAQDIVKD
ncbi:SLAP domain-containing protein [Lactobacillus intestinalis]|uniref:SLAP domain-containing protein n=1 Tax=Lactobacillus intestinalis TaxID=151781 RepID=UPI001F5A4BDC|nr:SLAP domain-containing protein [Lactobacillus intestinalis]